MKVAWPGRAAMNVPKKNHAKKRGTYCGISLFLVKYSLFLLHHAIFIAVHKFIDPAGSIDKLHFTGIERMRCV